jgi:hypothetical protein
MNKRLAANNENRAHGNLNTFVTPSPAPLSISSSTPPKSSSHSTSATSRFDSLCSPNQSFVRSTITTPKAECERNSIVSGIKLIFIKSPGAILCYWICLIHTTNTIKGISEEKLREEMDALLEVEWCSQELGTKPHPTITPLLSYLFHLPFFSFVPLLLSSLLPPPFPPSFFLSFLFLRFFDSAYTSRIQSTFKEFGWSSAERWRTTSILLWNSRNREFNPRGAKSEWKGRREGKGECGSEERKEEQRIFFKEERECTCGFCGSYRRLILVFYCVFYSIL